MREAPAVDALTFLTLPPRTPLKLERTAGMPVYYHVECYMKYEVHWKLWLSKLTFNDHPGGYICVGCACPLGATRWTP